jgi:hypothetical protein
MENKNSQQEILSPKNDVESHFDWKTILKQTERDLAWQSESVEALKSQARIVFGASSVVIPLFGTLQIFSQVPDIVKVPYVIIIALMLVAYIILVIFSLKVLAASTFYGPIEMDWDVLTTTYFGKSEQDILMQEITANLQVIGINQETINKKKRWNKFISWLFPFIVVLALCATMLTKLF